MHNVPVGPVLPVVVEALQQLDPILSAWHAVLGGLIWQFWLLDGFEDDDSSKGEPATILWMDTDSKDFLQKMHIKNANNFAEQKRARGRGQHQGLVRNF